MRRFRPNSVVVLAIAISALAGGVFGPSALATDERVPERYKTFTAALSAIESIKKNAPGATVDDQTKPTA